MSDDFRNRADLEATLVEINSLDPHDEWHLEYCGSDLFSVANLDNEWMTDGTFEQVNIRLVYLLRGMEAMTFVKCGNCKLEVPRKQAMGTRCYDCINELRGI
tara:strand:- start:22 stop:327 length:306 start_codon:yes stop_codon:yes gene_type:complete